MAIPLRCRCGQLQGELDPQGVAARAVCYCKDCQAFARFLAREGGAPDVLDGAGGTEVAASLPGAVRFTAGLEHLACLSLGPRGLYRWYAACCRTPIGNTPRDPKTSYVVLVRSCLAAPADTLDRELGASRIAVQTPLTQFPSPAMCRAFCFGAHIRIARTYADGIKLRTTLELKF